MWVPCQPILPAIVPPMAIAQTIAVPTQPAALPANNANLLDGLGACDNLIMGYLATSTLRGMGCGLIGSDPV